MPESVTDDNETEMDETEILNLLSANYELMPYRIRNILLVASLYDAFILEEDRGLSEQIFAEYSTLGISSPPRIKVVSTAKQALEEVKKQSYDLVITMTHLFEFDPVEFGRKIKKIQPSLPVVLLTTELGELERYTQAGRDNSIDRIFLWTGDSALFLAIIKLFEDERNVEHDTAQGGVRVIMLVEDSARYYSIFLPLMYREIMIQTQMLIGESANENERIIRRRARPKILLSETYEDAIATYKKYREYILGVITDVAYPREGKKDENAGFRLISNIDPDIPSLIQSSQADKKAEAYDFGVQFIDKNSDNLIYEFRRFLKEKLGFGPFVFRLPDGTQIGEAKNLKEFIEMVKTVPPESLIYHGRKNQFSGWLLARGEVAFARILRPKKISDFRDGEALRRHLLSVFEEAERRKNIGVIADFSSTAFEYNDTVSRYGSGSLGGKGRGIAFLSYLLQKTGFLREHPEYNIHIPSATIIATDEFDRFIDANELQKIRNKGLSDAEISEVFLDAKLDNELINALKQYLSVVKEPIAIRSSSLLEDSYNQPFAGVYSTYLLPNKGDDEKRLKETVDAIKLVYASTYFKKSRAYIKATLHSADEDKMAIVIQRLAGNRFGDLFFPVFSGVAHSYNFYPQPPIKREDGVVNIAMGLGKIVVEGESSLSFSPKRPEVVVGFSSTEGILKNSQKIFYALDMKNRDFNLMDGEDATIKRVHVSDIDDNEEIMKWLASVYEPQDNRLRDSYDPEGYKVITFAPILKYGIYPLPKILRELLALAQKGMGCPLEMEFAARLDDDGKPELNILQIRPILVLKRRTEVDAFTPKKMDEYLAYSTKALGNIVLNSIKDIVFVDRKSFDRSRTVTIANEIGKINELLDDRPYILIGPGRWGTRDRWLGIPVNWDQISSTRAIVETPIQDMKVDFSQGSHFIHNIASLNIPYLTIDSREKENFIDWEWLESRKWADRTDHVIHISLETPLEVRVDGHSGRGVILKKDGNGAEG